MSDFRSLWKTISGWGNPAPTGDFLLGVLKGEGIGPEIIEPTLHVLEAATREKSIRIRTYFGGSIGKAALRETGCSLTDEVKEFCQTVFRQNGAVLCGPAGGRFNFGLHDLADGIETAVKQTLEAGWRTMDIASPGCMRVGTRELGERIADAVRTLSLAAVS